MSAKNGHEHLQTEKKRMEEELIQTQQAVKLAGLQRKEENQNYQQAVSDQRSTIAILKKALGRLHEFYAKESVAMVQRQAPAPEQGVAYQAHGSAAGVLHIIQMIINDASKEETALVTTEQQNQEAYVKLMEEFNEELVSLGESIRKHDVQRLDLEGEISTLDEEVNSKTVELSDMEEQAAGFHTECDFLLKNFDVRQSARGEEIEALANAKAILSGADFS